MIEFGLVCAYGTAKEKCHKAIPAKEGDQWYTDTMVMLDAANKAQWKMDRNMDPICPECQKVEGDIYG